MIQPLDEALDHVRGALIVPVGNGLILGYLMYTSGLVPRWMPWLGLIRDGGAGLDAL